MGELYIKNNLKIKNPAQGLYKKRGHKDPFVTG